MARFQMDISINECSICFYGPLMKCEFLLSLMVGYNSLTVFIYLWVV